MHAQALDLDLLEDALAGDLPGVDAQLRLAHPARRLAPPGGAEPRQAGVLVLLYPGAEGQLHFPLIVRASHNPNDRHRGQISLPGGKREPGDRSLVDTALREAEEEVGADASAVRVIGQLSRLYIPVSNFSVQPVLGVTDRAPAWRRQETEVARVIDAPLARLLADDVVKHTEMPVGAGVRLRNVPYFDVGGEVVWGATAMILSELRTVVSGLVAQR